MSTSDDRVVFVTDDPSRYKPQVLKDIKQGNGIIDWHGTMSCSYMVINRANIDLGVVATVGGAYTSPRCRLDKYDNGKVYVAVTLQSHSSGEFDFDFMLEHFDWFTPAIFEYLECRAMDKTRTLSRAWSYELFFEIDIDLIRTSPQGVYLEELGLLLYDRVYKDTVKIPLRKKQSVLTHQVTNKELPFVINYVRHSPEPIFAHFNIGSHPHRMASINNPNVAEGLYISYGRDRYGLMPKTRDTNEVTFFSLKDMATAGYYSSAEALAEGTGYVMKDKEERERVLTTLNPSYRNAQQLKNEADARINESNLLKSVKVGRFSLESVFLTVAGFASALTALLSVQKSYLAARK